MAENHDSLVDIVAREVQDQRVIEAFRATRREDFVPKESRAGAYRDRPVALPRSQTTSQPSLIGRMIAAAGISPDDKVLEIGTGFGFQTAVLARLAREVVSVERHEELAIRARSNLGAAGLVNVSVEIGDGWEGWTDSAPYDAILVSAAAESVPDALADQLAEGGRLVIPVTRRRSEEVLLFVKTQGVLERVGLITPARFVPLVHGVARDP